MIRPISFHLSAEKATAEATDQASIPSRRIFLQMKPDGLIVLSQPNDLRRVRDRNELRHVNKFSSLLFHLNLDGCKTGGNATENGEGFSGASQ